jgi:hypothetical protein
MILSIGIIWYAFPVLFEEWETEFWMAEAAYL